MRTLTKLILAAAGLALVLGVAGQASALSSIDLNLLNVNGVDCVSGCLNGSVTVGPSDTLEFAIRMTIDTTGMKSSGFDLLWDTDLDNEMDLTKFRLHAVGVGSLVQVGFPPISYAAGNPIGSQESGIGNAGELEVISHLQSSPVAFASSTSFRVAFVRFHVTPNLSNGTGIDLGFFFNETLTGFIRGDNSNVAPEFGSFQIDSVPEPGTSFLMGMGVLGLIVAGRASRKR